MPIANRLVAAVLRSPLHPVLSGSTDLVRYVGARSGRTVMTPTQYASLGPSIEDGIVILVARPESKRWWRNFRAGRDLDVLVRGRWVQMRGTVVVGADDPITASPLIEAYCARFPRATGSVGATPDERARNAVLVWCRPTGGLRVG